MAQLGDQQIAAEKGSFVWLPRAVQHGFVVTDEPCSMLIITIPSGFERFVAEVGSPHHH